jgi:hypothetical protein
MVTFLIDGELVANRMAFGDATNYETGKARGVLEVRHAVTNAAILTQTLNLAADGVYTLLLAGSLSDMVLMVESDSEGRPDPGTVKLRVIHVAPEAAPIDLYLTEPGSTNPVPWQHPFDYRAVIAYRQGQPGTYTVGALLAGTDEVSRIHTLTIHEGRARTLVIIDGVNIYHVEFLELNDFL